MSTFAPVQPTPYGPPLINLLGAARTNPDGEADVRWQDGITYESLACGAILLRDVCAPTTPVVVKAAANDGTGDGNSNTDDRIVEASAVYAESIYECTALGWRDTYQDRAVTSALADLPKAIENEFWFGSMAQAQSHTSQRYLTGPQVTDITPTAGTAVSPTIAIGLLEEALGNVYSGVGIIHVGRYLFPSISLNQNLRNEGRVLRTEPGNYVVPGVGYARTGPTGTPALPAQGVAYAYITPMVTVRTGQVELPSEQALAALYMDKTVNRIQVRARTPFTVDWDGCGAFAVRVAVT